MLRKYLLGSLTFTLAFAILSISVFRSSSLRFAFASTVTAVTSAREIEEINIDYTLPYPGRILPDSPLWPIKALRDKFWLGVTRNSDKRAELTLLFADKRLGMSKTLFERGKPELAFSTLTKGEKYLEMAKSDDPSFLTKLANASLKHRQAIDEILVLAPEDVRPSIIKTGDYSRNVYKSARDSLNSKGVVAPINPFERDK